MSEWFDALNAGLVAQPGGLALLRELFWFKSLCLFVLMAFFLWLAGRQPPGSPPGSGSWRA